MQASIIFARGLPVAEAVEGGALLVGEVKWVAGEPSAASVEQVVRGLIAKGAPPVARSAATGALHHVVFVSRRPRGKLKIEAPNTHVIDAADVVAALR